VKPEEELFVLESLTLHYPKAFRAGFSLSLENYDHEFWKNVFRKEVITEADAINILAELSSLRLLRAQLAYTDEGFKERFIEVEARERGMTPEEFRAYLISELKKKSQRADNEFERELYEALARFLKEGKEIVISVNPERPVPLREIFITATLTKDASALISLLKPSVVVR
ncbi:MAG: hypothetical protein GXO04_02935, partial [Aquificae bacterium]|nr:hypothetical protein [Aquificota bacterium]